MVLVTLYIIELRDAEEGGLELVDPSWCPEEGPPRKKVKSPPAISPTGSSASLYSGASSSIDWTTTGTTLEMQGTRVTRTQYGFRTLQQSAAKMCLKVTGYPLPDITWYKDDVLLHEDERHTFYADDDGFFAMTIDPVHVDDTGRYTCMATNEYGQASTSAFFRVLKVEKEAAPPAFVSSLRDQECKEGETIAFECEVEGWPEPELLWLVDDQPLRPSADFKLQYDGQNARLEIRDAQPDDTGVYCVRIQNEHGSQESKANLAVQADPDKNHVPPEFQAVIEDVECREGDEVRFKAVYTGDPNPEIQWTINGIPITESEKIRMISEDGICILTIKDVTRHFDGIVTCQANNRLGTANCDARLRVRVPPTPPTFSTPLEDKITQEKCVVTFEVEVAGFPDPMIEFKLKGKTLRHGENGVEIVGGDGCYRLTIANCSMDEHDGELVCTARNEHGQAESRCRLSVEPQEDDSVSAPTFLKDIEDQTVKEGQEAIFETTVRGNPNPEVSWYINGHKMDGSTPGVKINVSGQDHKIIIDSASYAGTILCRAENSIGRFETKAKLVVLPVEKPKKAPVFRQGLVDETVVEGASVVFEVAVDGEPKPTLAFTLNGKALQEGQNVRLREFDGQWKLELLNIKLEEAGELVATATNSQGQATSTSRLNVGRKPFAPRFSQTPKSLTVTEGEEAVFTAKADGQPLPTYLWSVDGRKVDAHTITQHEEKRLETTTTIKVTQSPITETTTETRTTFDSEGRETGRETSVRTELVGQETSHISTKTTTEHEASDSATRLSQQADGSGPYPPPPSDGHQTTRQTEIRVENYEETTTTTSEQTEETTETSSTTTTISKPKKKKLNGVKKANGSSDLEASSREASFDRQLSTTSSGSSIRSALAKSPSQNGSRKNVRFADAPRVTRALRPQNVGKGDLAHYEAVIENAASVTWTHNGQPLTNGAPGVKISQDDKFEFRLSLDTAIFGSGTVQVVGQNPGGQAESAADLGVTEPPKETKKPEFTDKLTDIAVTRGQPFQVDVIALNGPEFKWTLNGTPMQDGKNGVHIAQDGNKGTLKVDAADDSHRGTVTVQASNEVNEPAKAPQISDGPYSTTVKEHEQAKFSVTITGTPAPTVKWLLNEQVIEQTSTITTTSSGTEYSLTFSDSQLSHSGSIKVTAQNSAGMDEKQASLTVQQGFSKPTITSKLNDTSAEEDSPVRFEVQLDKPQPGTSVKWYLNGNELKNDGPVQIVDHGDGTYHLTLAQPKPDMTGKLTVKVENPAGSDEQSAQLTVGGSKKKPVFEKSPQNHDAFVDDESVKFSAIVHGTPTPTVTWSLNGQKLVNGDDVKVKHEPETGKTSIRIFKPQLNHTGTVQVKAENEAGSVEATAQLKVEKKPEMPRFTTNMDDRQVNEGETIKYSTTVEGFPEPSVEWTLNGKPVSQFPNIKTTSDGNKHNIEIAEIPTDQSGELSCSATNSAGHKKQSCQLQVKLTGDAPTFGQQLEERLVVEGELVLMGCRVNDVKPKPKITWYRDGKEIPQGDSHFKLIENPDGTHQLRIVEAKLEDKGRITVKAENTFGASETSASLGVTKKRPMAKPAFQSDIPPTTVMEGESLRVNVLITGDPTPFVKWYINGQMVCETPDTELSSANGVYTMVIHGCTTDMTGKIKCVAYNKAGEVQTEGPLKVITPVPVEFETSLCDATCREGDTLKLKAVLLGEPTPVVTWYINGKKLEESQNIKIHAEKGTYTVTIKDITCDYSGKVVCEAINEYGKASSEAMLLVLPRGEPPDFLEWLSNVKARQGSKIVHHVVFTGDPKPELTWYINNKKAVNGTEFEIVTTDTTSTLTINDFNPDKHVGEIICKAENDAGEVSCTANMHTYTSEMFSESDSDVVGRDDLGGTDEESLTEEIIRRTPTPIAAPKFIERIQDTKAKKGHKAVFECVVPDTKGVVCKWLKDGKELELIARIHVRTRTIEGFTTHELEIEDVQPEDAGKYTCIVENPQGLDKCDANLQVLEVLEKAPPNPQSSSSSSKTKLSASPTRSPSSARSPATRCQSAHGTTESHAGKVTCVAENEAGTSKTTAQLIIESSAPVFTKSLEDRFVTIGETVALACSTQKIVSSERIKVEHDAANTNWRLLITECTQEDLVRYRAVATNSAGSAKTEALVQLKIDAPKIEDGLKDRKVKEKDTIEMEAKVSGTIPEIKWFKDGQPLRPDGNRVIAQDCGNGVYKLIIKDAQRSDAGQYKIQVSNPAGKVDSSAWAEVASFYEPAQWTQPLSDTQVLEKQCVTLSAAVTGIPSPSVEWLKDGQPVKADGFHVTIKESQEGVHSITIDEARAEDEGRYSAIAKNTIGEATTAANFAVIRDYVPPEFIEKLRNIEVKEKENATYTVVVKGDPKPTVEWLKDGQPVQLDGQHLVAKDEGNGKFSLTITDARLSDVGSYTARAKSVAGHAESTAKFAVIKTLSAPEFVEPLKNLEVKEKDTATYTTVVKGEPEPKVSWLKDGQPVQVDGQHVAAKDEGNGKFSLTISDARQSDVGNYTCQAKNEAGQAETSAKFAIVKSLQGPVFTEGLKPVEVKEQETATLSVTVQGEPAPTVAWLKDGQPVQIDNQHVLARDGGNGHFELVIKDARQSDIGRYTCKATNPAGQAETQGNVAVIEDVQAPRFTDGLKGLEVEEGKPAQLDVTVIGKPEPQVEWFKDGQPVLIDNQHVVSKKDEQGHHSLVIRDVAKADLGTYTCQATNKAGKAETLGEIKVPKYGFEKVGGEHVEPMFIEPLREHLAKEGDNVVLECKVNKESKPEVRFFKDGKPVELGPHMALEVREDGTIRLTINNATKEDVGSYKCEAFNPVGIARTDAPLELKHAGEGVEDLGEEGVLGGLDEMPKAETAKQDGGEGPPEFVELLRSCTVEDGSKAVLKCRVKGAPKPTIKWTKDGKTVDIGTRIRSELAEDGTITLSFDSTTQADAGEYRCFAENKHGSAWTEGPLIVVQKGAPLPSGDAPDFLQPVRPVVVTDGETAVLEGKISGKPKPTVKWYKNGEELKPSNRVTIEDLADGTVRLTIKNASKEDMSEYRCAATNELGEVWCDATLTVKPKGEEKAPAFTKELAPTSVNDGEKAVFECKVDGDPLPKIAWSCDGKPIEDGKNGIKLESLPDGTQRLSIDAASPAQQGNYKVEATNDAGTASSRAPLTVNPASSGLKIKRGLEDVTVQKGVKIRLSVEVEGRPKTVKWYKGTEQVTSTKTTRLEQVSENEYALVIEAAEMADTDSYRVVLSTDGEAVESSCRVTVVDGGDKTPTFKKGLSDKKVPKGQPLVLDIEVDGKPKAVKWYKGNDEIKDGPKAKIEALGDGKYRLTIPDFQGDDVGDYRVVVSNDAGEAKSSGKADLADGGAKPEIVSGLVPISVAAGETATFRVKTKGPIDSVKWYKNGQEIPAPKAEALGDGVYQLTIPNAKKDDEAEYKVVLGNAAGDVDSSAALTVKPEAKKDEPKKPEQLGIKRKLQDTTVPKGEDAVLEIETTKPPKEVKWYKNGKEVAGKIKAEKVDDNKYRLVIPKCDDDDVADYKVVLKDDDGFEVEDSCRLTVKLPGDEKPSKAGDDGPKFGLKKGLQDTSVPQGEDGILEVEATKPPKEVKWYKNGKEVSGKVKAEKIDDNKYRLTIPKCDQEDEANYKVVLKDDDGFEVEDSCALTVKLPKKDDGGKFGLKRGLQDTAVPQGEDGVLEVETTKPAKEVKWYKNGREVTGKVKPEKIDDNKYRLTIPKCDQDDEANYKVVLKDDDGFEVEDSCALTVKLPKKDDGKKDDGAPGFKKGLEDLIVPKGKPIHLEVETTGSPKQVKWYRNGRELTDADAKPTKLDDNRFALDITQAGPNDEGPYKVEISNDHGSATSEGKVEVDEPLTFLRPLKDVDVVEGEEAGFVVETNARVRTVRWYSNGRELVANERLQITAEGKSFRLTIRRAEKSDAGEIKVVLGNAAGEAESSAKLTVKKGTKGAPKILKGLEDAVVAKGDKLVFEVKVEGDDVTVKWLKDGAPIPASANAVIEKIDDNTYRLTIPKADVGDAGKYTAEASNDAGKAKSDAKGEVDEKPEITRALEPAAIDVGDDHIFRVEVSKPVRQVKWYRNGQELKPDKHIEPRQVNPKKFELAINKALLDDGATYKVVLSNAAGECESSAELTVAKPESLKLLEGLKDVTVDEGQPIELKVKVEGRPRQVKWYRNGQELAPGDGLELKANPESGEYSLRIPAAKKSDGAAYRVVLSGEKKGVEVASGAVAHVKAERPKAEPKPAIFMQPLRDTEVPEGETLTLTCQIGGDPLPALTWFKDGAELVKDDRTTWRVALDGTATLRVRDARASDFGTYKVVAKNDAGEADSQCKVSVSARKEEAQPPKFVIPLRACANALGAKQEFNVKVRGHPKPTLEWTIDGKPLVQDGRITVEDMADGNYCLTIRDIRAEDFGVIRCVAKNENGSDDCEAKFVQGVPQEGVDREGEGYPPKFNVPLWDRRIPVGDVLAIECHVDAKPHASIKWFKDNVELLESELCEIRNSADGACRVRLARFTEELTGCYRCQATNCYGVADTRAYYEVELFKEEEIVEKKERAPKFNPGLEDKTTRVGERLVLSCKVDGSPLLVITWYKDGCPVRADGRHSLEGPDENGICQLIIHDVLPEDEGAYRCVAENSLGSCNTACQVTVKTEKVEKKREGEEPSFTKGLVDAWTERGASLTLKCEVRGDPFPEIKWYRNGALVRNGPRTRVETTPEGVCTLTVSECTMSDEGIYRCEAENKHGKAKTQATAHVDMGLGKADKAPIVEGEAPRFVIPLSDCTLRLGSTLELECKVTGKPMPNVKWSKDGALVADDARFSWDNDQKNGSYRLSIRSATAADEGTYRCVASNESGSATTKSFVRIDEFTPSTITSRPEPPRFSIKLGDARAVEGQPLHFECKIEGSPFPEVTWFKDGARVTPGPRIQLSVDPATGTASLHIPSCNMDDEGIYRVVATNPAGSAHDKGQATVKRAPKDQQPSGASPFGGAPAYEQGKAPKLIDALENARLPEGDNFTLRCKFAGDGLSVKWYKDGERLFPFGRVQIADLPDGVYELRVEGGQRQDTGAYRCVAENAYGSARTAGDVNVQRGERRAPSTEPSRAGRAPGFTIPLTVKRVKEGEPATLECLPFGEPFPTIKWLKDGIELVADERILVGFVDFRSLELNSRQE
ncbi:unnamed protein product, partial [Mesorhabditis spiculigera]